MSYSVELSPRAKRDIKKLSPAMQKSVITKLKELADNPFPQGVTKLSHQDQIYRVRIKDMRILYRVHDAELKVLVLLVGKRKDIYKRLKSLK